MHQLNQMMKPMMQKIGILAILTDTLLVPVFNEILASPIVVEQQHGSTLVFFPTEASQAISGCYLVDLTKPLVFDVYIEDNDTIQCEYVDQFWGFSHENSSEFLNPRGYHSKDPNFASCIGVYFLVEERICRRM